MLRIRAPTEDNPVEFSIMMHDDYTNYFVTEVNALALESVKPVYNNTWNEVTQTSYAHDPIPTDEVGFRFQILKPLKFWPPFIIVCVLL